MTLKEKAIELIEIYRNEIISFLNDFMKKQNAKKCALITVDEILNNTGCGCCNQSEKNYWNQVKQEIENYDTRTGSQALIQ